MAFISSLKVDTILRSHISFKKKKKKKSTAPDTHHIE